MVVNGRIHGSSDNDKDEGALVGRRNLQPSMMEICQPRSGANGEISYQTTTINERAWPMFQAKGALYGPCDEHCSTVCNDNDACTVDECDGEGGCLDVRKNVDCDDSIGCTDDTCDSSIGCVNAPNDGLCDDGVDCTDDACDSSVGCVAIPNDTNCDQGKICHKTLGCVVECFFSCQAALEAGKTDSGVYTMCPSGDPNDTFDCYCDQVTDGGGWMLFFAYNHKAGEHKLIDGPHFSPSNLPTDPLNGYSHANLEDVSSFYRVSDLEKLRFYCQTSNLSRASMHFTTENEIIKQIAFDGDRTDNTASSWNTSFTALADHDSPLPAGTELVMATKQGGLWHKPFFRNANPPGAWAVYSFNDFNCGDSYTNGRYDTLHNIWARFSPTPAICAAY